MALCLNLGSGDGSRDLDGYVNIDRMTGGEVYPLAYADGSVDEIRASHILEHFSHRDVEAVIRHWVDKLRPGGLLRVAVPNFRAISKAYLAGDALPVQGLVMGGHVDAADHHGAIFDKGLLTETLANAGLERIRAWTSEIKDCAATPVSLNLMGYKPARATNTVPGLFACLAAPRYGLVTHFQCYAAALAPLNVPTRIIQGCFWWQHLSVGMQEQLNAGAEYILTLDYDTVFGAQDVVELYRLMQAYEDADAICAVQSKRGAAHALFNLFSPDGTPVTRCTTDTFAPNLTKLNTGHFGLTIFRGERLRSHAKPWMCPRPNELGDWDNNQRDADMDFWDRWLASGRTLYLANHVIAGHVEDMITWPDRAFRPIHQSVKDYFEKGIPPEAMR